MQEQNLERKVAQLEFINDQLEAEMNYIDQLLRLVGFQEGLSSVKLSAQELLNHDLKEEWSFPS